MRVAVVGATGAVGREMIRILEERDFPADVVVPLASERSAGRAIAFRGRELEVRPLSLEALDGVDIALSSCGGAVARTFVPQAAERGTVCIDNSSAFRMEPWAGLVIPEINPEEVRPDRRVYCVPNCTIITTLMAVAPLHRAAGLRALSVASYQAVSGAGHKGVRELAEQIGKLAGSEEELGHPDPEALPRGEVFGKTIAYNVVAKIDAFDPETGFTFEEIKMAREAKRILALPDLEIAATCVRVPVVTGHSVAVEATFERELAPTEAREILAAAPGVRVMDDPANLVYPSPLEAAGGDDVLVGRIRRHPDRPATLLLFACGDNLRKGAALNAVQIAEAVLRLR